ncbi:MAG: lipoate--protein ligase family protein [Proteobacteria bacterium]|nr:lipoate--protein ligase family protein [Pseudomonadota bacterium]
MRLYNLGKVPWQESQLIYHALAELGWEALCLVSPATPYVCIGFHQDAMQEVDMDYCRVNGIPVFRREVGGGAVYLDGNQLFFQLVLRQENPAVPKGKAAFYEKFLRPVINVYRQVGIRAEYKPVNDVIVGGRKISGTGVGEIGDCIVFVGNLIVDFNYEAMSRVLKVPDEKFRDKIHKTLRENLSTIRRELGEEAARKWDETTLNGMMVQAFQGLLGAMDLQEKDEDLQVKMDEIAHRMTSDEWLFQKGKRASGRNVKIRAGVNLVRRVHKAPGGLIRADFEVKDGRFEKVSLSGDFFCYPEQAIVWLEEGLEGQETERARQWVAGLYSEKEIETPGIGLDDWMRVLAH